MTAACEDAALAEVKELLPGSGVPMPGSRRTRVVAVTAIAAVAAVVAVGLWRGGQKGQVSNPAMPTSLYQAGTGIPVRFELFGDRENNQPMLRIQIEMMLGGKQYSFMADTGSATLALCKGEAPPDGASPILHNQSSMFLRGMRVPVVAYDSYGGGGHGWAGQLYEGPMEASSGLKIPKQSFATMQYSAREYSNACGKPVEGISKGAREQGMNGIMGLGGSWVEGILHGFLGGRLGELKGLPGIAENPNRTLLSELEDALHKGADFHRVSESFHKLEMVALTMKFVHKSKENAATIFGARARILTMTNMMRASKTNAFGIYWNGAYGPDAGKLLLGDEAISVMDLKAVRQSMSGGSGRNEKTNVVCAYMSPEEFNRNGMYQVHVNNLFFTVDGEDALKGYVSNAGDKAVSFANSIVDTGTANINLPAPLHDAIDAHFDESDTPVTISIEVNKKMSTTLFLRVSKDDWNPINFGNGGGPLLGLSSWKWFSYVIFDFTSTTDFMTCFVPRGIIKDL